ncbi:MAG: endonuclease/exonuclease/phosphatase family protein [Oscillibacter sp.]
MNGIPNAERQRLGALLDHTAQAEVMARIPQFAEAAIHSLAPAPTGVPDTLGLLVFNMERGVHLAEIGEFLRDCPAIQPFDVILANELDDGCLRSGGRDTARELAEALGLNYVYSLEFIELINGEDPKGYHGNALFSRWPIKKAKILRLPEQYNWYHDRQRRIGGRCAILAELDVGGQSVGMVSVHLENRTHGEGRRLQTQAILQAVEEFLPGLPVAIGGDFNTNTFDGRDTDAIRAIASSPALQARCLEEVPRWEGLLPLAEESGYRAVPETPLATRRKPLPQGGALDLRLDWLLLRGFQAQECRVISTRREACGFAVPGGALAGFTGEELSDHNAVWARCALEP